jgi:hypothetical protein
MISEIKHYVSVAKYAGFRRPPKGKRLIPAAGKAIAKDRRR